MLNGFGYTLYNSIPSRDLETTWKDVSELGAQQSMPPSSEVGQYANYFIFEDDLIILNHRNHC
jgi:hypothetical protein